MLNLSIYLNIDKTLSTKLHFFNNSILKWKTHDDFWKKKIIEKKMNEMKCT